mmetsp:Transcript_126776/g.253457  ORF Transcript_126776/g.253457 Transcript_126776/m.253457 type:complete len:201 (+) Transcript_126776:110-712(+)|eukprot:CAMPEP_0172811248 /NCGR_PEP_ID=MMETSP1075-20121228/9298_1 /TAXON_ID=2916 /ORGANISM="Ceratium fusus, Strain PA161109" /LENGTH=200 /DNA_ID=CAMNT_0013650651 /DNA_START=64 /DNA_END=666 /DNA_ORIENTATION=-
MTEDTGSPVVEMCQSGNGWRGGKPVRVGRRRTKHPLSAPSQPLESTDRCDLRTQQQGHGCFMPPSDGPLDVMIRVLYFSNDGNPADTGSALEFTVPASSTVASLLDMVRAAVGVSKAGRLMFKGKQLTDSQQTLGAACVGSDPKALQFMLARKFRPATVAEAAAVEAAELANAMAQADADFRARPPRQRKTLSESEEDNN